MQFVWNAAGGESQAANIAWGQAECYICHKTLTKRCIIISYKLHGGSV